jgi:hypothetical protein
MNMFLYWPKWALRSQSVFTSSAKHAPAKANAEAAVVIAHNCKRILLLPCCLVGIDLSRPMHLRFQIARSMSAARVSSDHGLHHDADCRELSGLRRFWLIQRRPSPKTQMPAALVHSSLRGYSAWADALSFGQLADRIGFRPGFMVPLYLGCVHPSHTFRRSPCCAIRPGDGRNSCGSSDRSSLSVSP